MVTFESDGSLTFRVYLPHAESVELVADFTSWTTRRLALTKERSMKVAGGRMAAAMASDGAGEKGAEEHTGWWTIKVRCPEGDHAFSYLVDNQWWLPDYAAHGVKRNEQGNWTSLLFVPPKPRLLERIERRTRSLPDREERTEAKAETGLRVVAGTALAGRVA
jgi:1,4-alpha-glucan branching enzyme